MRVTVIGSGDAFHSEGRGHACCLVESKSTSVALDLGATAMLSARRCGAPLDAVDAVLLTHAHGDHFLGVPFLLLDATFRLRRTRPLEIHAPPDLVPLVSRVIEVAYADTIDRHRTFDVAIHPLPSSDTVRVGDLTVETFAADHLDPPRQALGLRLTDRDGVRVVYSGDTRLTAALRAASEGVDLLLAECTTLEPSAARHISWEEWREALASLSVRRVLLTHLGDGVASAVRRDVPALGLPFDVAAAEDGQVIDLP